MPALQLVTVSNVTATPAVVLTAAITVTVAIAAIVVIANAKWLLPPPLGRQFFIIRVTEGHK